jgi:hypothetical protein
MSVPGMKHKTGEKWRVQYLGSDGVLQVEDTGCVDEFVLDDWLHLENMSEKEWWIRIGDARVWVTLDKGRVEVQIERNIY